MSRLGRSFPIPPHLNGSVLVGKFDIHLAVFSDYGVFIVQINPADYPPGTKLFFEAVLATSNASFFSVARLFNITDGTSIADSQVESTNITSERVRSSALTLISGDKEYRAQRGGLPGATYKCFAARVVVKSS